MVILKDKKMLNPKTGRLICVGSPTWRKLVLEGVLPNTYEAVDVLADAPEDDYERERICAELASELGEEFTARRGTGMYKDKIIKIRKPPTQKYTLDKAKKAAKKIIADRTDEPMEDDEEIDKLLNENFAKLAVEQRRPKTSKLKKTYKIKKAPEPEPSSESSEEEKPKPKAKPKKAPVVSSSSSEEEKPKQKKEKPKPKKASKVKAELVISESDSSLEDLIEDTSEDE
jgi:D-alanyl-D-alanine carboxypeptidase